MAGNNPEKIALWGYGVFGKRTSESMKKYWGGAYVVTRIDDIKKGERDPWWELEVSDPKHISEDYRAGVFEKVMVCLHDRRVRKQLKEYLDEIGIPWFFPGSFEDIVPAEHFEKSAGEIHCARTDEYSLFCLKNMRGALSDHDRIGLMYLFDEDGKIPEESVLYFMAEEPDRAVMTPFRLKHATPERVKLAGSYCVLARLYSENYWHFTFLAADCVSLLEDAGYQGKYVIAGTESNLALMHLLGVGDDRIVKLKDINS